MITVTGSTPAAQSAGWFLDDPITLTLTQEIEASFLSGEYIKLYRTNEAMSEFFELVGCTYSKENYSLVINPLINLLADSYYLVVMVGGENGIQSIGGDVLEGNYLLSFRTGDIVRPSETADAVINDVELYVDGRRPAGYQTASYDLISTSGDTSPIAFLGAVPQDRSVGIGQLTRIGFIYDDDIAGTVPSNALRGTYQTLPFDSNFFADRSIYVSGAVVSGSYLYFDVTLPETENREFIFTLSAHTVRGVNKRAYDRLSHEIRYLGPLSPLYALPDQIRSRLQSWNEHYSVPISDYELFKLIHERSKWFVSKYGIVMDDANRDAINRALICFVLLDIVGSYPLGGGALKSRELLATKVEYYNTDMGALTDSLENCIDDALNTLSVTTSFATSIKSGDHIDRQTKRYGTYR